MNSFHCLGLVGRLAGIEVIESGFGRFDLIRQQQHHGLRDCKQQTEVAMSA